MWLSGQKFVDSEGRNPDHYPALLFYVNNITSEDNTVEVLKKGTYYSPL